MQYTANFLIKVDIFHIFAQHVDCKGDSNEYPQPMFWNKNMRENNVYPCNPCFAIQNRVLGVLN